MTNVITDNEIILYQSLGKKLMAALLLLVIACGLGLFSFFNLDPDDIILQIFRPICGLCGVICFLVALYYIVKCFSNKPVFIVNDLGITDYTTLTSYGFMEWSDIADINIETHSNVAYIVVKVTNNEAYLKRKNIIARLFSTLNKLSGLEGSPITTTTTGVKLEDLYQKILVIKAKELNKDEV